MVGLRAKRIENHLTMRALAEQLGLNPHTIYCYEKGLREPNFEMLKRMSILFRCTVDELM